MLKEARATLGQESDNDLTASRDKRGIFEFNGENALDAASVVGGESARGSRQGGLDFWEAAQSVVSDTHQVVTTR